MKQQVRLAAPVPIHRQLWPRGTHPVVSIMLMTYNHEKFVGEAIDGFLAQETSFPVEIIAHDDASTDNTVSILRERARQHPHLFKVIEQAENQHSRGNRAVSIMMPSGNGEYIALCEGDDYWTDPAKLESQVRLLDSRPDASGSIHRADARMEAAGELLPGFFGPPTTKAEYGIDDLLVGENFVPTASIVLRRTYCDLPSWLGTVPHGDIVILCNAARRGPLLHIDESMAVYRKHAGGLHTQESFAAQAVKCIETLAVLGGEFGLTGRPSFRAGLRFRLSQMESEVKRFETALSGMRSIHEGDREEMKRIMATRTFRLGLSFHNTRQRLAALFERNAAGVDSSS